MASTDRSSAAAVLAMAEKPPAARAVAAPGDILLIRHGRPAVARSSRVAGKVSWRGFDEWWRRYSESGLAGDAVPPDELQALVAGAAHLVSSSLPRAVETAHLLAEGRPVSVDALFVEAPLPAPHIPLLVVSPSFWWVLARLCWLCGFSGGLESRAHAQARAEQAARRLALLAEEGTVALCGHGWFNRMIARALRHEGWACRADGGDGYWSVRRYSRS
ncbi:MAG: histidine phosphatase family protein [Alphaproteobacteria bacterium]|nr:histidine phosphatase family protein [Alphaproteobacteria bacterium]